jgi:glycosyltransferase involved in cell wall biosynthesis
MPEIPAFSSPWRRFRRSLPAALKGALRRPADRLLPNREAREYRLWMTERLKQRAVQCDQPPEAGLLSILTPVWDGSPTPYLRALARALIEQNRDGACEWVVLDNGCSHPRLTAYLDELREFAWIRIHRLEHNAGIIAGLRYCLEHASGRYIMPVDADDLLYPDALRVAASYIRRLNYPALLYSDEDKINGTRKYQPYMKPDWDPVLLLNSAYIAHLGILDRKLALELGAYADPQTEGSPDWDAFTRFLIAGYEAAHIPEVLYSWRVHAHSTADDAATKPYVHASQRAVLQRFLDARAGPENFRIEYSPRLNGIAHWHFARERKELPPCSTFVLGSGTTPETRDAHSAAHDVLLPTARALADNGGLIRLIGEDVRVESADWQSETAGLLDLHPDVVMIGAQIRTSKGVVMEAGRHFGFAGPCGCPHRGRSFGDPGYFGEIWKQRSVSAVATQFAVVRASFLRDLLRELPEAASLAYLGAWAGAFALRTGKHVAYSPFLSGLSDLDWDTLASPAEQKLFALMNRDLIPDRRFYSRNFSLEKPFAFGNPKNSYKEGAPVTAAGPV